MYRRLLWHMSAAILVGLLVAANVGNNVQAQLGPRCFPETQFCIAGRIREFWEQNGGLPVFGFPITAQHEERVEGLPFLAQWFERNRLELHPENAPPYDVLLGRLGDDRLRQQDIDWRTQPRAQGPQANCLWFEQTRHNVCDQSNGLGFKTYWLTHGLQASSLNAYQRSLALFGLPLTEPQMETNSSGDTMLTQWFERARFEWHPGERNEYKVLLGLLGSEVRNNIGLEPTATMEPTSTPTPGPTSTPTPEPTSKPRPRPRPSPTRPPIPTLPPYP